jgi:hypothetical protein
LRLQCEEGNEGERCADEAEEDYSLLSHGETMQRKEANERAD